MKANKPNIAAMALPFLACVAAGFALPGEAQAQASASPYTTGYRYDATGRQTGVIKADPDGPGGNGHLAVRNTYDSAGRLIKVETGELATWQSEAVAPAAWSGFTVSTRVETNYDTLDRKILEQTAKGSAGTVRWVKQYSYDVAGRLECTALRMNPAAFGSLPASACTLGTAGSAGPDRITRNVYDLSGQLVKVQKAVGTNIQIDDVTYTRTPNGKREYVTDARGYRARFIYDGHDRLFQWNFPDPNTPGVTSASDYEAYQYDANGNRTYLRKRDGRVIHYGYDALNRVTSKTYQHGGARPVYYAYDLRGLQTMARFDSLSGQGITNAYDGFGRLTATTAVMNLGATEVIRNLNFAHDANGNRTRITYPDNQYVEASWDGLDRFYFHNMSGGTNLNQVSYNAEGQVATLLRWGAGTWGSSTVFGYNGMSQLVALDHSFQNSAANVSTTFDYNPARQIVSRTRNNNDYRFDGYTNIDRGYARNGLNQYTTAGDKSFGYDANGNLTSEGAISYTYDIENRLVSSSTGVALSYDPLGRLAQVTQGGSTTQFLYDGDALVAEYDGTGAMTKRYVHGPTAGQDDPLVEYLGSGVTSPRHLMADHQGSVVAIADASGNRVAVNGYDEYGIPNGLIPGSTPNTGRFQYTGQVWLPELGMYHYKARVYSPTLGRFLQTDPIGYDDQINLYAYVANDPLNNVDPTGTQALFRPSEGDAEGVAEYKAQLNETMFRGMQEGLVKSWVIWANIVTTGLGGPAEGAGVGASAVFAQTTFREGFSKAGMAFFQRSTGHLVRTIDDLAGLLRARQVKAAQVPIETVTRKGQVYILNTRSAEALRRGGIPRSQWRRVDRTGDVNAEGRLTDQLKRNGLDAPKGCHNPMPVGCQ